MTIVVDVYITTFWDIILCYLVDTDQFFGENRRLLLQNKIRS